MARDPVKHAANQRVYYARHREEILAKMKEDKEHTNEVHRKRREKNIEKVRAKDREWYANHKEQKAAYDKIYRERTKEKRHYMNKWKQIDPKYAEEYYKNNKDKIIEHNKKHRDDMWYKRLHWHTQRFIKKNGLRPNKCSICWKESKRIIAHHPNYDKRNEVVFVCQWCHHDIHLWYIECPEPIDLLSKINKDEEWHSDKSI